MDETLNMDNQVLDCQEPETNQGNLNLSLKTKFAWQPSYMILQLTLTILMVCIQILLFYMIMISQCGQYDSTTNNFITINLFAICTIQ